ncbi:MAG TPA: alpha-L-fucosidase [bacterium]|nr:alpha-L-fucosidase [bacterium]
MKWKKAVSEYNWKNYAAEKFLFRFMIGQHTPDYDQNRDIKKWLGGKNGKGIGYKTSPKKLVRLVKDMGADVFYFYAKCHQGNFYYPSPTGHVHSAFKNRDFFGEMIQECIRQDIIPAALYETLDWRIMAEKPEWCFRNSDKSTGLPCLNSPYGDFVLQNLKEILTGYPLYAIYFDMVDAHTSANMGMLDSQASAGIACPHCEELYKKTTGREYPDVASLDFAERKKYLQWHAENYVGRFLKRALSIIEKHAPNCRLEHNFHNDLGRPWVAHDWKMTEELTGIFTCDIFAFWDGSLVDICVPKEYRTASQKCRSWILEDCSPGADPSTPKPFDFYKIEMASVMSNGLDVCTSIFMEADGTMDKTQTSIIRKEFEYFKPLKKYYVGIEPLPFALVVSPYGETTLLKRKEEYTLHREEFEGWLKMLTENQVLYDIIVDSFMDEEILSRYKLVILPHCESLSDEQIRAVRKWTEKGGMLIVTGHASLIDGQGNRRKDFGLNKLMGVSLVSLLDSNSTYMHITDRKLIDTDDTISPWHTMPAGQVRVKTFGRTQILARIGENPVAGKGKKHHIFYRHETDYPSLTMIKKGNFSACYFAGLPGATYLYTQSPALSRLAGCLISPAAEKFMPVYAQAPSCVQIEAALQKNTGRIIINLMNRNGMSGINALVKKGSNDIFAPQHVHKALPVHDIKIIIRENLAGKIKSVLDSGSGRKLKFVRQDRNVIVRIDKLDAHKIIVCDTLV